MPSFPPAHNSPAPTHSSARKPSPKQLALGITNIVGVKNYKIENVIFIGQKDKIYINERFSAIENIDLSNIKKLFQ